MNKSLLLSSKVFVFAVLLSGISYAMESNAPVSTPVVTPKACSSSCFSFKENWNALTSAVSLKKAEVARYACDVNARGWTRFSRNEKIAFAAVGAAVVAAVGYGIYKVYQSCTKADKNTKDAVRKNRN